MSGLRSLVAAAGRFADPQDDLARFARQIARRLEVPRVVVAAADAAGLVSDAVGVWRLPTGTDRGSFEAAVEAAASMLREAPATILDVPRWGHDALDAVGSSLADAGVRVAAIGFGPPPPGPRDRIVAVVAGGDWFPEPVAAPEDFRVLAIMTAYNEVDIVRPSIERLLAQGIEVHLLDNWSTDGTGDAVADLVAPGRLTIERHPEGGRPEGYDWTGLLHKVSEVAAASDADWCVHHDVDQRRDSPWPGVSYRDALYRVQTTGWNAVDHTIFEFRPTDDDFVDGTEVSDHLRHFELVPAARSAAHVQAWRNERVVDLSETGGHDATFEGRRVFPLNFTLRHYPIRSQRHGDRKVFRDRVPRYAADEMARGWHYHYARLRHGHRFVLDPAGLHPYDETTFSADFMLPRVGQTGIPIREAGARNAAKAVGVEVLRRTGALPRLLRVAGRDRS